MALATLAALALGLAHLRDYRAAPQYLVPVLDAAAYDGFAVGILQGTWPAAGRVFYQDPLYPYFLAFVYRLAGHRIVAALLVQVLLGAAAVPLIYAIARRAFGTGAAVAAAILLAAFKPLYFFEAVLDKEVFCLALLGASLWFLTGAAGGARPWRWPLAGLLLGLACLVRANLLLMIPVWGLWIVFAEGPRAGRARGLRAAALFFLAACAAIAPVTLHNIRAGDFNLVTSQGGQNFYTGNRASNLTGMYQVPPFVRANPAYEEVDFRREAERLTGRAMKPSEVSAYWYARGLADIRSDPARFLRHLWRKVELLLNDHEVSDNVNYYFVRERYSRVLRLPSPGWGFMAALALWGGAVLVWRRGEGGGTAPRAAVPLLLLAATYAASLLPFFVYARFRIPLLAAFAPLAGFGASALWGLGVRSGWARRGAALAAVAALGVWTHRAIVERRFDIAHFQTGNILMKLGRRVEAEAEFREAARINPQSAAYRNNLSRALLLQGRPQEALAEGERAVALDPGNAVVHENLGNVHLALKDYERAIARFRLVMHYGVESAGAWRQLGMAYQGAGRASEAADAYRRAAQPGVPRVDGVPDVVKGP